MSRVWDDPAIFLLALGGLALLTIFALRIAWWCWDAYESLKVWWARRQLLRYIKREYGDQWHVLHTTVQNRLFANLDSALAIDEMKKLTATLERMNQK